MKIYLNSLQIGEEYDSLMRIIYIKLDSTINLDEIVYYLR